MQYLEVLIVDQVRRQSICEQKQGGCFRHSGSHLRRHLLLLQKSLLRMRYIIVMYSHIPRRGRYTLPGSAYTAIKVLENWSLADDDLDKQAWYLRCRQPVMRACWSSGNGFHVRGASSTVGLK